MASCSLPMDNAVRYIAGGKAYITYMDWKGAVSPDSYASSVYHRLDRFIHKDTKLITTEPEPVHPPLRPLPLPRFNPTVKQGFYGASDADALQPNAGSVSTEVFYTQYIRGNYWLSKQNDCISWDADNIYIKGGGFALSELTYYPSRQRRYVLVCCCLAGAVTEADLASWGVDEYYWADYIGQLKVVVVRFNVADSKFYVSLYYYNKKTKRMFVGRPLYQREITADGYNTKLYMDYVFVGFKTDSKTLVYTISSYNGLTAESILGGVFTMTFNDTYTAQTITKLGGHNFAEITEVSSINESGTQGQDGYSVVKQVDATLSKNGHHIMQVFHHKDDFTVIYEDWNELTRHERYTLADNGGNVTQTVDGNYQEQRDITVHKIDWEANNVITANKTLLSHQDRYTYGSNDTDGAGNYFYFKEIYNMDSYIIFASASLDLYIYRDCTETSGTTKTSADSTLTTTTVSDIKCRLVIDHNGEKTVVDEFEVDTPETTGTTTGGIEAEPWSYYYNGTDNSEAEWFFLDIKQIMAFDGTLVVCCLDLWHSNLNIGSAWRKNPRTLIYNVKTKEWQLLDYRVDNNTLNQNQFYPLSVTQ